MTALQVLAAAILALVVGLHGKRPPSVRLPSSPVMTAADAPPPADALKPGRMEPKIPSAPVVDRLFPARLMGPLECHSAPPSDVISRTTTLDKRREGWRLALVKPIPRMERDEPPRDEGLSPSSLGPALS